jgi:hypothetical protein
MRLRGISLGTSVVPAAISFAVYLGIGEYVMFVLHAYHGDAYSRVANAYWVLFSRDPHLAAIGFVWMPLPSIFELALLPAKVVFPALAADGFAAVIMSATFMALAVATLYGILVDFGIRAPQRLALVGAFALNPMILYYGAIGTSEAPTLFFALLACRHLARYCVNPSTASLVTLGLALAGGYLTRYEAAAAPVGVAGLILLLSLTRVPGTIRTRVLHASADIAVALTPFVLVFVAWAVAGWLIVGTPFSQFTSEYGNSSQMAVWAAQGANEVGLPLGPSILLAGIRLTVLSIAAPVGLAAALWLLAARRDPRVLAVGAVLGPMLGFMVLVYLVHLVAPWLRYYILVIPLGILLLALVIAPRFPSEISEEAGTRRGLRVFLPRFARGLATTAALAVVLTSVPIAAAGMLSPVVGVEEAQDVGSLLGPDASSPQRKGVALKTFTGERAIAAHIDAMNLPRGSVLLDVFGGFAIVMNSTHPDQFVITPDTDFKQVLADPTLLGVTYVLAPAAGGTTSQDAILRAYPNLGSDERFATVVADFPAQGSSPAWTLYRLTAPTP